MSKDTLDISALENWLWEAACKIRGEIDAPKYKDYILLPLIFLKRLSDVFESEILGLSESYGDRVSYDALLRRGYILKGIYKTDAVIVRQQTC